MTIDTLPPAPAGVIHALGHLAALGGLLACVDPGRWDSLARPLAGDLAALVRGAHADLVAEISELVQLPGPD